ncbi:unnamed protein product [Rotaria socialis]|uniref:F-box domain-containing protein n=1 Tax=Rotaria socialis TaxID=392032 RepID=A0A817ZQ58_9BILA|nr:unnamed protein product [Rotaria socialis]CAF4550932.1 unnamed protein product [Rotaria socialis]
MLSMFILNYVFTSLHGSKVTVGENIKHLAKDNRQFRTSVDRGVTCWLDLPDQMLLLICSYLSPGHVLQSFYTPSKPTDRLHRAIFDYYTKIKLDTMTNDEYLCLMNLFCDHHKSLRFESLKFCGQRFTCLTQRFFHDITMDIYGSLFDCAKHLTIIDCPSRNISIICRHISK